MSIYKAYDIRGIYPGELNEDIARRIGGALTRYLGAKTLVVGRDMRESSPSMASAIIEGVTKAGADVIDIGLASTPMVYYGIGSTEACGGVAVTASHNPAEYTGLKMTREQAIALSGDSGIKEVEALVKSDDSLQGSRVGTVREMNVEEAYRKHVTQCIGDWRPMKIVIDTANGMGGYEVPLVLEGQSALDITWLYRELDGRFPNHEANPLKDENLEDLAKTVLEKGADIGFSFDGDADRCAAVDEKGARIPSDILTAYIARPILEGSKGGAVVYDLRSSRAVPQEIEAAGGTPVRERVGHSFMKATLRDRGGPFGGELSGHFYFRDNFFADSATMAMVHILNIASKDGRPMSEQVAHLRRYHTTGEVNFEVEDKDGMIKSLGERYKDAEIDFLDGITVQYDSWWFNVRKSNTEPLLRLMLEAEDASMLDSKFEELKGLLGNPI